MIHVTISDNIIESKGHAYSRKNDETYDLVCCAVSAIMITWVNGLDSMGIATDELDYSSGMIHVLLSKDNDKDITLRYVDVLKKGIRDVATKYPKHVTLNN